MEWCTGIITFSTISFPLIIDLFFMKAFGLGINTMILGVLVLAISLPVDDVIIGMDATNNLLVYGILAAVIIIILMFLSLKSLQYPPLYHYHYDYPLALIGG